MPRGSHKKLVGQTALCALSDCGKSFERKQIVQRFCCPYHKVLHNRRKTFERRVKEGVRQRLRALADLEA